MRSDGGDEALEGSLVLLLPLFRALCVMSSRSALVSSLLGSSAGDAMGIVVIGGMGGLVPKKSKTTKRQYSYLLFLTHGPAIRGLWSRGRSHGRMSCVG